MNKARMTILLAALAISLFAQDKPASRLPVANVIEGGLYDMTDRWQVMFGLNGRLKLSTGRSDARAVPCDGPEIATFEALPMQAGWYSFVFSGFFVDFHTGLTHTVVLHVDETNTNLASVLISPKDDGKRSTVSAGLHTKVNVRWSKGEAGGWDLVSTSYSDAGLPSVKPPNEKTRKDSHQSAAPPPPEAPQAGPPEGAR